ncbi:hypothetical protein MMC25_006157 [Agyrium rufum]|nr:hypothetical protein [Agyrium rufum]
MGLLPLSLEILFAIILFSRLQGVWKRPGGKRAGTRPANRHPIDVLYPTTEGRRNGDPDVEPDYSNPNVRLHPQVDPEPDEADVDIIAVHGLGSDADWSWTWKQEGEASVEWLKDPRMLPGKVKKARILRYYYHSKWDIDAPDTCLEACGKSLISRLHTFRKDQKDRPLIFIGHSLGGLVIEYGLLWADSEPEYQYFTQITVGCLFLGCPFIGSKMQIHVRIAAFFLSPLGSQIGIIEKISYENEDLFHKLTAFCHLIRRSSLPVSCFYEVYDTDYGKRFRIPWIFAWIFAGKVVNKFSASVLTGKILPADTDHVNLNKFCGPNDRSFVDVAAEIVEMYDNIGTLLRDRRTEFEDCYRKIGQKLGIPGIDDSDTDVKALVKEELQRDDFGRWLLVVDQADDATLLLQDVSLSTHLPFHRHGSILFITRNRQIATQLKASVIDVPTMNQSDALKLLTSENLNSSLVKGTFANSTNELLYLLTNLPLAVRQASNYLDMYQTSSTEYVETFQSSETDMIYLLSWTLESHNSSSRAGNSVITTHFPSFQQISASNALAFDYVRLMSFLADRNIHGEILVVPSKGAKTEMREAIGTLAAYSFVTRRNIGQLIYYDIHRLVQVSVRAWMRANDIMGGCEWAEFSMQALQRLEDVFSTLESTTQDAWRYYLGHAHSVSKFQSKTDRKRARHLLQKIEDHHLHARSQGGGEEQ